MSSSVARSLSSCALAVRLRAQHQVVRAPEVGDQLAHRQTAGGAVVDGGVGEAAGGDAAVVVRIHGGQIAGRRGHLGRAHLARHLRLRQRQQPRHADVRVVRIAICSASAMVKLRA